MYQADGPGEEKISLLKKLLDKMLAKAELGGVMTGSGSRRGSTFNAEMADNLESLEKKLMEVSEELEQSKSDLDTVKTEKDEL
jgi:hypothetical protein